jgi:leader peptidase (prepilin peptidase)/N-methyltransferase
MDALFQTFPLWLRLLAPFIMGTVVGSFVNVLIYRIPEDISIVTPPSMCPRCKHRLLAPDLVPLFSFLASRRKCRYCGEPISWRYFSIEFLTGAVFAVTVWQFGLTGNGVLLCALFAALIAAFFIDLGHFIIPDELNYFCIGVGLLRAAVADRPFAEDLAGRPVMNAAPSMGAALVGAVALAVLLLLITKLGNVMFRKQVAAQQKQWEDAGMLDEGEELEAMGIGDVKLAAAMGANLGLLGGLLGLFIGFGAGAIVGIALKVSRRLEGHAIPFGPYLIAGTTGAVFYGPAIVTWYLGRLGIG